MTCQVTLSYYLKPSVFIWWRTWKSGAYFSFWLIKFESTCWLFLVFSTGVKRMWLLHLRRTSLSQNASSRTGLAFWWRRSTFSPCLGQESQWVLGFGPRPPSLSGNAPGSSQSPANYFLFFCFSFKLFKFWISQFIPQWDKSYFLFNPHALIKRSIILPVNNNLHRIIGRSDNEPKRIDQVAILMLKLTSRLAQQRYKVTLQ